MVLIVIIYRLRPKSVIKLIRESYVFTYFLDTFMFVFKITFIIQRQYYTWDFVVNLRIQSVLKIIGS